MSATSTTATHSKAATRIVELPVMDELISRVEQAKKAQLTLSPEDCDLLLNAVLTLASMQERLSHNELTISKLKKLMGMVRSSEKMKDLFPDDDADTDNNKGHKDKRDSRDTRSGQKASGKPRKLRPRPKETCP